MIAIVFISKNNSYRKVTISSKVNNNYKYLIVILIIKAIVFISKSKSFRKSNDEIDNSSCLSDEML